MSCEEKIHLEKKKTIESQESEYDINKNSISYELLIQKASLYDRMKFNHKQLEEQDLSSILSKTTFFCNSNCKNEQNRSFNPDKLLFIPQPPLLIPGYIKEIEEYNRYRNGIEEFNKYKNEILQIEKKHMFPWARQKMKATRVFMDHDQENKIDMSKYDIRITKKNVFLHYKTKEMSISKF